MRPGVILNGKRVERVRLKGDEMTLTTATPGKPVKSPERRKMEGVFPSRRPDAPAQVRAGRGHQRQRGSYCSTSGFARAIRWMCNCWVKMANRTKQPHSIVPCRRR